jgi:hypothetical protein
MEDDLKIFKVKQLKNKLSDLTHISSSILGDKTKIENWLKEDNLKILKVDYLSNHLSDLTEILNSYFIGEIQSKS